MPPFKFLYETFVNPPEGHGSLWYAWAGGSIVLLWFFMWWSVGMMPAFGGGFAKVEDVQGVKEYLMSEKLLDARIRHCMTGNDASQKKFYYSLMVTRATQFLEETGKPWSMPSCEDVVYETPNS